MGIMDRISHAWNSFLDNKIEEHFRTSTYPGGVSFGSRADRPRLTYTNEKSIISSIYTRLAVDIAASDIRHVRLDDHDRYLEDMKSGLNECLTLEANIDQAARQFRFDVAMTVLDKGVVAIVPVDTTVNPDLGSYDIKTMRVGEIISWMPQHIKVMVYNEATGQREQLVVNKKNVAIVENPLYAVMNEPNSTLQRLIRKLNLLDAVDEQAGSGKLDLIIQLPYVIKSEARRQQAEQRRTDIEYQLKNNKYGIAYTDGTEKVTQLNRPAENNLLKTVEYLTEMLYGQLGLTPEIMKGTADEATMLNYMNRTIEPILAAITEAMKRRFLTKTARSQKQTIMYFRDPFKLVPIASIAEIADKFTRNKILTSNEIRQIVGYKPSMDPSADKLENANMPQPIDPVEAQNGGLDDESGAAVQSSLDSLSSMLDEIFADLEVVEDAPA